MPHVTYPARSVPPGRPHSARVVGVGVSVLAHLATAWGLSYVPQPRSSMPVMTVTLPPLTVPDEPQPQPQPQPQPVDEKPKAEIKPASETPHAVRPARAKQQASERSPAEAPDSPAEAPDSAVDQHTTPVALPGLVLSNAGMAVPVGGTVLPSSGRTHLAATARPNATLPRALVALSDLSRKPEAPSLNTALRRNYPAEHRRSGTAGQASVRVLLSEQGLVLSANVATQSHAGFGDACRKTVLHSRWSPPIDRSGNAVRTELTYRCTFTIDDP